MREFAGDNHFVSAASKTALVAARPGEGASKIQWAFRFFHGPARDAMGMDHRRPHVAMTEKGLNCPDVVVGLQKMCGKGVAEGMGRDAFGKSCSPDSLFQRLLNVRFMKMIASKFLCVLDGGKRLLRKEPLPYEILHSRRIFLFERVGGGEDMWETGRGDGEEASAADTDRPNGEGVVPCQGLTPFVFLKRILYCLSGVWFSS
jgi:hypothetical protein